MFLAVCMIKTALRCYGAPILQAIQLRLEDVPADSWLIPRISTFSGSRNEKSSMLR
jgi:hypothetical protein